MAERNDGREFEERIHQLLSLNGVQALVREKQFTSKKADLYFEVETLGSRRKYAVECKDIVATLSKADLSAIRSSYEGLFRTNEITDLLVVSNKRLSPGAQSYLDAIPELSYQTESDLRNSIINFGSYLTGLKSRFEADPVRNYYISPQGSLLDQEGKVISHTPAAACADLHDLLISMLDQRKGPLAVLGAYGIGKTTLARQLFLTLLNRWERDPGHPIPIYISLDQMQREQSLEGMLGSIFTSISPAAGYNFDIFCSLNEQGHLVLLLDGIDEMRHKLNKEEFLYNVDQLALLSNANRRTVLLGRPSAFMDEEEYHYVVHGKPLSETVSLSQRGGFSELQISMLSSGQIAAFVDRFCSWRYPTQTRLPQRVLKVINQDGGANMDDISRRPIQLMMLLDIFPQLPKPLDSITKATIYSVFIDELIKRERAKRVSRRFSHADHRQFGRAVAWWLWRQGGRSRIEAKQIGMDVLQPFIESGEDPDAVRRSLVSASFLSTEGGSHLHFPHRSIQEYLIAEQLCLSLHTDDGLDVAYPWLKRNCGEIFTPEVVDFLGAQLSADRVPTLLAYFDRAGTIPQSLLGLMRSGAGIATAVERYFERTGSITAAWLCTYDLIRERKTHDDADRLPFSLLDRCLGQIRHRIERFTRDETYVREDALREVSSYLLCLFVGASAPHSNVRRIPIDRFLPEVRRLLLKFGRSENQLTMSTTRRSATKNRRFTLLPEAFLFLERLADNTFIDRIDVQWVYKLLRAMSADAPFVQEWIVGETLRVPNLKLCASVDLKAFLGAGEFSAAIREFRIKYQRVQSSSAYACDNSG